MIMNKLFTSEIKPSRSVLIVLLILISTVTATVNGYGQQIKATSIKISGKVTDPKGEPLVGVTIVEKGTNNATITDVDGNYSLYNISSDQAIIRFTYVGFKPQEKVVLGNKLLNVSMIADDLGLDEVVVVAYGTQKKESVVGAISTLKPEELQVSQTRSLTNGLAGMLAGVIAVQRSGEPGYDGSDFWIKSDRSHVVL